MIQHWPNAHPGVYFIASNTRPNVAVGSLSPGAARGLGRVGEKPREIENQKNTPHQFESHPTASEAAPCPRLLVIICGFGALAQSVRAMES